ncbi:MAG: PIG-L family deacetylase [Armatimonadota bacterium]|nr:PIG-L family deacetylase [Armatimonadota bacterium]
MDDILAKSRILIIAPHPDDETYGCGGLIARARALGGRVFVMVASAGDLAHYDTVHTQVQGATRQQELAEAMRVLGVEDYCVLFTDAYTHMRLDAMPRRHLLDEIERNSPLAIDRIQPDIVVLPAVSYNQDHEAVFKAGFTACRPGLPSVRPVVKIVLSCDAPQLGWNWDHFHPNLYVDISDYLETKLKAHACHQSQLRPAPHHGSLENLERLARLRGAEVSVDAAEAFFVHRWVL